MDEWLLRSHTSPGLPQLACGGFHHRRLPSTQDAPSSGLRASRDNSLQPDSVTTCHTPLYTDKEAVSVSWGLRTKVPVTGGLKQQKLAALEARSPRPRGRQGRASPEALGGDPFWTLEPLLAAPGNVGLWPIIPVSTSLFTGPPSPLGFLPLGL